MSTQKQLQTELTTNLNNMKEEIQSKNAKRESLEWYLLNNIELYLRSLDSAKSYRDFDNAVSIFSRFCTESMDWDAPLYKSCTNITKLGFKLSKLVKRDSEN